MVKRKETRDLVILLGNTNNAEMELSPIAKDRADYVLDNLSDPHVNIVLPTGSWGEHFNCSRVAHGVLLRKYLESKRDDIVVLDHTYSSNTFEDAKCARSVLNKLENSELNIKTIHVVTSDFHMERVRYIFDRVFIGRVIVYHKVNHDYGTLDLNRSELVYHEMRSLSNLKKRGFEDDKDELIDAGYESLGNELRHYDNLSYLPIAGIFVVFSQTIMKLQGYYVFYVCSILLYCLYYRLANTARKCRKVMAKVENMYGVPGISGGYIRNKSFVCSLLDTRRTLLYVVAILNIYAFLCHMNLLEAFYLYQYFNGIIAVL